MLVICNLCSCHIICYNYVGSEIYQIVKLLKLLKIVKEKKLLKNCITSLINYGLLWSCIANHYPVWTYRVPT